MIGNFGLDSIPTEEEFTIRLQNGQKRNACAASLGCLPGIAMSPIPRLTTESLDASIGLFLPKLGQFRDKTGENSGIHAPCLDNR
jgi:hypothetical protein